MAHLSGNTRIVPPEVITEQASSKVNRCGRHPGIYGPVISAFGYRLQPERKVDEQNGLGWQACCIPSGMNDLAYDISHLFEAEMMELDGRHFHSAKVQAPVICKTVDLLTVQEATARELLQAADIHEALIQQYLRIAGDLPCDVHAS